MMEQNFSWHCCGVSIVTYDITYVFMISYYLTWSWEIRVFFHCQPWLAILWQSLGYSQIRREDGGTTRTLTMQALLSLHCIMPWLRLSLSSCPCGLFSALWYVTGFVGFFHIFCHSFSNLCALGVCYVTMLLVVGHSSDLIYARNIPKYAFDSFMNEEHNTWTTASRWSMLVVPGMLFLLPAPDRKNNNFSLAIFWRSGTIWLRHRPTQRLSLCIECMALHKSHGYNVNATKDSLSNRHPLLEAACGVAACCCVAMHFLHPAKPLP